MANDGLKHSEIMANQHHRSLSSSTRLNRHTQLTIGHQWCHEEHRVLVQIARGPRQNSQQKQISNHRLSLTLKSNSTLTQLCICVKKLDFLSWAISPLLSDQVTYANMMAKSTGMQSEITQTRNSHTDCEYIYICKLCLLQHYCMHL